MKTRENLTAKRAPLAASALAAALLLLLLAPAALADEPAPEDFAGSWRLNAELSDMPDLPEAPEGGPGRGPGMRGAGGRGGGTNPAGRGGGMGRGGKAPAGGPRGAGRGPSDSVLILGVAPDALTVTRSSEITHTMKLDGESHEIDTPRGKVRTTARWQAGQYIVDTAHPKGGTITRRYILSEDGKQLTVSTQRPDPKSGGVVTVRQVFDRQED